MFFMQKLILKEMEKKKRKKTWHESKTQTYDTNNVTS